MSKSSRKKSNLPTTAPTARSEARHPWVIGDIDFGPAVAAVLDLAIARLSQIAAAREQAEKQRPAASPRGPQIPLVPRPASSKTERRR